MDEFERWRNPEISGAVVRMRNKVFSDGSIPAKYKVLAALAISIAEKCKPCARSYYQKAVEMGAPKDEIKEILEVAITMGACIAETWAREVLQCERSGNDGESCCEE